MIATLEDDRIVKGRGRAIWDELANPHSQVVRLAAKAAALIDPSLLPNATGVEQRSSKVGFRTFPAPKNGMAGRLVRSAASTLAQALFPATTQNAVLELHPAARFDLPDGREIVVDGRMEQAFREILLRASRGVLYRMNAAEILHAVEHAEAHGMVCSTSLIHCPKNYRARSFCLENFRLDGDTYGNLSTIVTFDKVKRAALTPSMREAVDSSKKFSTAGVPPKRSDEYELLTVVERQLDDDDSMETAKWEQYQEIEGVRVPGSEEDYGPNKPLRWLYFPWRRSGVGVYGISQAQLNYGQHAAYEGISQILFELAAILGKRVRLLKKGSIDMDELAGAPQGGYVYATDPEAVFGENHDQEGRVLQWLDAIHMRLGTNLAQSYGEYNEKPVERRTTVESQYLKEKADAAQGGIYNMQIADLVKPAWNIYLRDSIEDGEVDLTFPMLKTAQNNKLIIPHVIAGPEALAKSREFESWGQAFALIKAANDAGVVRDSHRRTLYGRMFSISGLDVSGELLSEEEMDEMDQMAMDSQNYKGVPQVMAKAATTAALSATNE